MEKIGVNFIISSYRVFQIIVNYFTLRDSTVGDWALNLSELKKQRFENKYNDLWTWEVLLANPIVSDHEWRASFIQPWFFFIAPTILLALCLPLILNISADDSNLTNSPFGQEAAAVGFNMVSFSDTKLICHNSRTGWYRNARRCVAFSVYI